MGNMKKETIRLDKYLSEMGVGTRSEVKNLIRKGKVLINSEIVKRPEEKVCIGQDQIAVDGKTIGYASYEYYMLNKPAGVISATSDPKDQTVIDLISEAKRKDLFPVGRLDKDTEGLLIITNDGDLAHQLLSPKKHVDKVYFARVLGHVTNEDVEQFKQGLKIGQDLITMPAHLEIIRICSVTKESIQDKIVNDEAYLSEKGLLLMDENDQITVSEIELTIREGKFHQVKRMFEAVNKKVIYLKRISMGSLRLDETLELGQYRPLTERELEELINDKR